MEIKRGPGQTLLTLLRIGIFAIAALCVFGMQSVADTAFALLQNSGGDSVDLALDEETDRGADLGQAYGIYYKEAAADGTFTHIYKRYYITGEGEAKGLVDAGGREILAQQYQDILPLPYSCVLKQNNTWRFYDYQLNPLTEDAWDSVELPMGEQGQLNNDLVKIGKNGLYGAADHYGQIIISPAWDEFELYGYEAKWPIIRVKKDGHYGFIDSRGNVVIGINYDYAQLDLYTYYDEHNPANEERVPIVYIYLDGAWGGIFKDSEGWPTAINWEITPTDEVLAAYQALSQ